MTILCKLRKDVTSATVKREYMENKKNIGSFLMFLLIIFKWGIRVVFSVTN